jgi:fibronectin type 3 domain-containing protein
VFAYGASLQFPTGVYNRSNYWVDVIFRQDAATPAPPPTPTPTSGAHTVGLNWTASTSPSIQGYNAYRGTTAGGPYTKVNSALTSGTTYVDNGVTAGKTYYYVVTAVDATGAESGYSNEAAAVIPR